MASQKSKLTAWIDNLRFRYIFLLWVVVVCFFGGLYHFLATDSSHLAYNSGEGRVTSWVDHIYFSFITATTTGFGDILPRGRFKGLAIIEVICGYLLLALVTSKLVSIKQDIILSEIYDISFSEKVNRLRSSFFLFRQNLSKFVEKIEEKTIHLRDLGDINGYLSAFEDTLGEVISMMGKSKNSDFLKSVDPLNMELIMSSILKSDEKIFEIVESLNKNHIGGRRDVLINLIHKCMSKTVSIFEKVAQAKTLSPSAFAELAREKEKIHELISQSLAQDAQHIPGLEKYFNDTEPMQIEG